MPPSDLRFALNHMVAPRLDPEAFFALARAVGVPAVEIRNDLVGNAILDGTPAKRVRALAEGSGVRILTINALQRFEDWPPARASEAAALADYARACGAEALVLVPSNDGTAPDRLPAALEGLRAILAPRGLMGLVEPLGFATSALRAKSAAVAAIGAVGGGTSSGWCMTASTTTSRARRRSIPPRPGSCTFRVWPIRAWRWMRCAMRTAGW